MVKLTVDLNLSFEELNTLLDIARFAKRARTVTTKQMGEASEKLILEALEELKVYTNDFSQSIQTRTAPDLDGSGTSDDA